MDKKEFMLAVAVSLLPGLARAQGVLGFGAGPATGPKDDTTVIVTERPDAHWHFQPDAVHTRWQVRNFSPNLDGVDFKNNSKCYGHSLLSTRWFQYIVKPLKDGTVSEITADEFRDFWGGHMDYPVNYSITPSNVDGERLYAYSHYNDTAKQAIGKLVGYYYRYQSNLFDHSDTMYSHAERYNTRLVNQIARHQLPPQVAIRRSGGAHALSAWRVEKGTAMWDNRDGGAGTRMEAYRISLYDPNRISNGNAATDEAYADDRHFIVFEDGGGFLGMSEKMEKVYGGKGYLEQAEIHPTGMWQIPDEKYGTGQELESDDGEIRDWHWSEISDAEARRIASLP